MFTGIIEELGAVKSIEVSSAFGRLKLGVSKITEDVKIGDSIAVNGVCLTVVNSGHKELCFDIAQQTIQETALPGLKRGDRVNLERSIKSDGRFSGHFVAGHIDGKGLIKKRFDKGENLALEIEVSERIMQYIIDKGSVAVDGVSLTVGDIGSSCFTVFVIPHTKGITTLGWKDKNDCVNIEVDILGKYIHKFTTANSNKDRKISNKFLKETGFI